MEEAQQAPAMRVLIKPGCPWCVEAVQYLRAEGFVFNNIDVLADSAAFNDMIALSGQSLAPTLEIQGKILPDFDVNELKEFLSNNGITPEMTQ